MKIMTGIDLHSNNALCGLLDESGHCVLHKKLPCDLPAILQVLAPYWAFVEAAHFAWQHDEQCGASTSARNKRPTR